MTTISFTIFQIPTGKKAAHHTKSGITYSSKEQRYNANSLMTEMMQYRPPEPITDPIILDVQAYFPIPVSKPAWFREAALDGLIQHDKKPDADNVLKMLNDCMQTLQFIKNDSQIFRVHCKKGYSDKPRWEIQIRIVRNITKKEWLEK